MICTKSAWDISQKYEPYLPTYEETVEQITTNKNNILTVADSGGAKNKIYVSKLNTTNANGVTYTINNDGTVTANGTPSGTSPSYVVVAMPDGGTYKDFSEYCNGDYVLSGCPQGGNTSTYRMYITGSGYTKEDFGNGVELSATVVTPVYLIIYIYNGYTADNLTFKPMICTKSMWDVSHTYQPYARSNAELTAKEQVNENNISSLQDQFKRSATAINDTIADNAKSGVVYGQISLTGITDAWGALTTYVLNSEGNRAIQVLYTENRNLRRFKGSGGWEAWTGI
jgi:hypothetical protein